MTRAHHPPPQRPGHDVPAEPGPGELLHEHEHGQEHAPSTRATADAPDPVIAQAKRDLDAGLVDTDMHATAGLDARLRARLVPGAGGKPPTSVD